MALITVSKCDPVQFGEKDLVCLPAGATILEGEAIKIDTNGKWVLAEADSAATAGRVYYATHDATLNVELTGVGGDALVDIGDGLAALAYDTVVYLSDTPGKIADAAGTVSYQAGTVAPGWGNLTPDKLLRLKSY